MCAAFMYMCICRLSDYEQMREANIARNQARFNELFPERSQSSNVRVQQLLYFHNLNNCAK